MDLFPLHQHISSHDPSPVEGFQGLIPFLHFNNDAFCNLMVTPPYSVSPGNTTSYDMDW